MDPSAVYFTVAHNERSGGNPSRLARTSVCREVLDHSLNLPSVTDNFFGAFRYIENEINRLSLGFASIRADRLLYSCRQIEELIERGLVPAF